MLLVGAWTIAQLRQGPTYDPEKQTISVLASYGASSYWLMTGILIGLGTCYVATAHGLRTAAFAGRAALAGGGLAALALTLVPAPSSGGALKHGTVAGVGFVLLAVWPLLAADRRRRAAPWGLRFGVSLTASALMCVSAMWFVVELQTGTAPGVAERALTFVQALWPFLVVISCQRRAGTSR